MAVLPYISKTGRTLNTNELGWEKASSCLRVNVNQQWLKDTSLKCSQVAQAGLPKSAFVSAHSVSSQESNWPNRSAEG